MNSDRRVDRQELRNELHVWTAHPDSDNWLDPDLSELSGDELARQVRFLRGSDRHLFLVAHAFVRRTLSRYVDIAPKDWEFATGQFGRPEITNQLDGGALRFNLSHTDGCVALIVHDQRPAGVDVERVGRVSDPLQLAKSVFAQRELEGLALCGPGSQEERFYRLWTLKESFIKATGRGLHEPLKDFWFDPSDPANIEFGCRPTVSETPGMWRFTTQRISSDHYLATASASGQSALRIRLFD